MFKKNKEDLLKTAKDLLAILSYDITTGRPIDICGKLFDKYKIKYTGTLYHGLSDPQGRENGLYDILDGYHDWVSCSSEFMVAFDFAQGQLLDNNEGFILKIELKDVEVLDVHSLILDCFEQLPNIEIRNEIYDYASEHEYLLDCYDLTSNISSIEVININTDLKENRFKKYIIS